MTELVWDNPDKRFYEFGVDRGVFYPIGGDGVPWNGITAVSEAPSGSDISENYYDGFKYRSSRTIDSFTATIEAYTYPKEFELYDGVVERITSQNRRYFNFSYRSRVGNGDDLDAGYQIHLVYNASVAPTNRSHSSISSSVSADKFSWQIETVPELFPSGDISAHLIIDSRVAYSWALEDLEKILYGTLNSAPRMPTVVEIVELFEDASILRIIDHGDGTWTAIGPDEAIQMLTGDMFEITWPSAVFINSTTYRISSL